jgi:hypothetical protein
MNTFVANIYWMYYKQGQWLRSNAFVDLLVMKALIQAEFSIFI